MKKKLSAFLLAATLLSSPVYASLDKALATTAEGAVEFPVGLVKLVGGIVWTIGEAIAFPFTLLF